MNTAGMMPRQGIRGNARRVSVAPRRADYRKAAPAPPAMEKDRVRRPCRSCGEGAAGTPAAETTAPAPGPLPAARAPSPLAGPDRGARSHGGGDRPRPLSEGASRSPGQGAPAPARPLPGPVPGPRPRGEDFGSGADQGEVGQAQQPAEAAQPDLPVGVGPRAESGGAGGVRGGQNRILQ